MRMCLTGDVGGYYSGAIGQSRDQFGTKGDFITSPEISQIFGELIGIWLVAEWTSQGRPERGVQIIEVGPGRGTLMNDVLRTIQRFPPMANAVESIFMVEASRELREAQRRLLCEPVTPANVSEVGHGGTSKHLGKPIVWTETMKSIPKESDKVPFILAHEFFDALPIHSFQSAPASPASVSPEPLPESRSSQTQKSDDDSRLAMEWREMMVSPTPPAAIKPTSTSSTASGKDDPDPEFQLTLSSGTTRHSRYLPDSSPRYRGLKQTRDAVVEICPDASLFAADFSQRIGGSTKHPKANPSGAALIIDYGTSNTVPINSLRGIRHHRLVDPLSLPGLVDLSADVDFTAIAESATLASDGVEVHGPVSQGDFLEHMGIRERANMLTKVVSKDVAENIDKSWKRLVDRGPSGMGRVYKVLAILPENDGRRRPVGFGGDVGT
ncbi:hypothetical protein RJ55_03445 [Drechmeria coniospora]|nr:hypothetical protein RJ55_03445 [Drechmeria coniospora]